MTNENKNFLGIPVEGYLVYGSPRIPQRPLEDFGPLVQALLDDPTIVEFGWIQYTPYFNDGDECIFNAHTLWVRTDNDNAEWGDRGSHYNEALALYDHPSLGKRDYHYEYDVNNRPVRKDDGYTGPDVDRYDRCKALERAIEGGEFDDVLKGAFGDHADITVTNDGIRVDHYEHD